MCPAILNRKYGIDQLIENIKEVSEHFDADVYTYIGVIYPPDDQLLVELIRDNKSRKNALLIFDTPGGSVDATYRIARAFQRTYKTREPLPEDRGRLIIYVHEICKSAGTLLTLAADELILSQFGELGPIDVQLRKDDEVGERMSGLTPHQALETLQMESGQHFARFFRQLRFNRELGFSTRLSADIAAQLVVGLMGPVYSQLDPARLGEVERFVRISSEYGDRLRSKNVRERTIARLAGSYPSHEFVIDRTEARELFERVTKPTDSLEQVWASLKPSKHDVISSGKSVIRCLSREVENEGESESEIQDEPLKPSPKRTGRRKESGTG